MRRFFIILGAVALSFLVGYGIVYVEKRQVEQAAQATEERLQAELAEARANFRIAAVTNQLGIILIEVNRQNFGNAKQLATNFFDDLGELSRSVSDVSARQRLSQVLARRDEIITDLVTLKPETAAKLQSIYLELATMSPSD
jgi:hypothetical protein